MKFTFSALKKYLKTDSGVDEICSKLNNIGLEVEELHDKAKELAPFFVAKIISANPHPDSTKLQICMVDVGGKENLQVICGAKNARSGLKIAFAPIGALIPANGMIIKKAKIAGVESNGMICSSEELGLGKDGEGIIEVNEKFAVGTKIAEVFGLDEKVIEINLTPNRGDCLGVFGIARDLAATGMGQLINPEIKEIKGNFSSPINAIILSESCKYFGGFYIKDVQNKPSPKWLKEELEAIGQNSISAIVDITNYMMMQTGQPLHAYDADKLSGDIVVDDAKENEEFKSLKDVEYQLKGGELVIKNNDKVIGLAGVIGGSNSLIGSDTKNIFLEAAFFDADAIAKSGRSLNILSDARYRFERGVDLENVSRVLRMAANLIMEICGGEISHLVCAGNDKQEKTKIEFDLGKIKQLIGIEIPKEFSMRTFDNLGFIVKELKDNLLEIKVPTHRNDVKIYQDLIEEIVRIYGLNQITSTRIADSIENKTITIDEIISEKLANSGLTQVINYSFIDEKFAELFSKIKDELRLQNPIATQMNYMRPTLVAALLQNVSKNQARGFDNLAIFEMGLIFDGIAPNNQKNSVSALRIGKNKLENHYQDARNFDVFDIKKDLFDCLESLGFSAAAFAIDEGSAPNYYHPHRSAAVKLGKNIVGFFGEVHPAICKKMDVKISGARVNIFEIFTQNLPINLNKKSSKKSFEANDLLALKRDFAFILDKKIAVGNLLKSVTNLEKELITEVNLFDIYHDQKLGTDKKSIAFEVVIQPKIKTLTGEEIDLISQKIITEISEKFGAVLRDK